PRDARAALRAAAKRTIGIVIPILGSRAKPMGLDQSVTFPDGPPPWQAAAALLAEHGFAAQLRMIDGELAFPDEQPPDGWRELRLGTPQGMVTVRRENDRLVFVTWGNAGPEL